jgi:hypothetical protein
MTYEEALAIVEQMKGRKTKELRPGEEEALKIVNKKKSPVNTFNTRGEGGTFKPHSGPATKPALWTAKPVKSLPEFKKGGKVKKTGPIMAHKGEYVLPASVKPTKKQMSRVSKMKKRK